MVSFPDILLVVLFLACTIALKISVSSLRFGNVLAQRFGAFRFFLGKAFPEFSFKELNAPTSADDVEWNWNRLRGQSCDAADLHGGFGSQLPTLG